MYNIFNDLCEVSNSNLVANSDYLLAKLSGAENKDIVWIGENKKRFDESKFKLTYEILFR